MERQSLSPNVNTKEKWIIPLFSIIMLTVFLEFSNNSAGGEVFASSLYVLIPGTLIGLLIYLSYSLYRKKHVDSKPFILFTIGISALFIGEQLWTIYKDLLGIEPFPSPADFFYLSFYPFFFGFFYYYLKPYKSLVSKKVILFGFAVSVGILFPTLLATYEYNIEESNIAFAVALAYPLVDVVILGVAVISTLVMFHEGKNYFWIMINAGIFIWILANSLFLYSVIDETYYDGHPVDIMWLASYTIWIFAVIDYQRRWKKDPYHTLSNYNEIKKIRFHAISQYAIPISVGMITLFSIITMNYFGVFENPQESTNNSLTLVMLIFVIISVFSAIIVILNNNLTKLVRIREHELEEKNEQLVRAERYSAIGELSARIAHDVRNPLSVIQNSVLLLISGHEDHLTENDQKFIGTIKRSIRRIAHQTNDVLDFVKEVPLVISRQKVDGLIKNVISDVDFEKNIDIEYVSNSMSINCDPHQMNTVLVNLVLNSIQAMENKGKITIRTKDDPNHVIIEIEDSGPGVPENIGDGIFDPLVTTKQEGTGLGLASCRRIIEQHGGSLTYKNNPTTFSIKIPK